MALVGVAAPTPALAASPWAQDITHGYAQLSGSFFLPYDSVAAPGGGELALGRTLGNVTVAGHVEAGLGDGWDLRLTVPFRSLSSRDVEPGSTLGAGNLAGPGDVVAGVRYQAVDAGGWALAACLDVSLPTGSDDPATGLRTGPGTFGVVPGLALGRGWDRVYGFAHGSMTYRAPLDGEYDTLAGGGLELGFKPVRPLAVAAVLDGVGVVRDSGRNPGIGVSNAGVYVDGETYLVAGAKLHADVTGGFGIGAAGYKTIVSVYTPRAFGFNAGADVRW